MTAWKCLKASANRAARIEAHARSRPTSTLTMTSGCHRSDRPGRHPPTGVGGRRLPDRARFPTGPSRVRAVRWRGYLEQAPKAGDDAAYRHYSELTVLLELRDGRRSGAALVPHLRRYADLAAWTPRSRCRRRRTTPGDRRPTLGGVSRP